MSRFDSFFLNQKLRRAQSGSFFRRTSDFTKVFVIFDYVVKRLTKQQKAKGFYKILCIIKNSWRSTSFFSRWFKQKGRLSYVWLAVRTYV
jgi:hypothetical protein